MNVGMRLFIGSWKTAFFFRRRFSLSIFPSGSTKMSIDMKFHAFAGSNIKSKIPKSIERAIASALNALEDSLLSTDNNHCDYGKILSSRNGRPLVGYPSEDGTNSLSVWQLEWLNTVGCRELVRGSEERPNVYLGVDGENYMLWGLGVSSDNDDGGRLGMELGRRSLCFVELRTLIVATDWTDVTLMQQLTVAGQGRAGRCLNGVWFLTFVGFVEPKQFLLKLEGRSNV